MNRRPSQSRSSYDAFAPGRTARFKVSAPDTDFFDSRKRRSFASRLVTGALILLVLLLILNAAANQFVLLRRVDVPVTGLTEEHVGYTLLHISDLKGATFGQNQARLISAIRNEAYDVVVMTGDMISEKGNAEPLYALIEALRALNPEIPIYFIAGDDDPEPVSMRHAAGGSPFAPWVLGAQQRGAELLRSPKPIEGETQTLWLLTAAQLSLDLETMQQQYEQAFLRASDTKDSNEIELAKYNLTWLNETREARESMQQSDVMIALTHTPPAAQEMGTTAPANTPIDLLLAGHYLGGLVRLPLIGPLFIPAQSLPRYGLFPGADVYCGLSKAGSTWTYTSPGLGSEDAHYPSFFPRIANPPSVTLLTLTPSSL